MRYTMEDYDLETSEPPIRLSRLDRQLEKPKLKLSFTTVANIETPREMLPLIEKFIGKGHVEKHLVKKALETGEFEYLPEIKALLQEVLTKIPENIYFLHFTWGVYTPDNSPDGSDRPGR